MKLDRHGRVIDDSPGALAKRALAEAEDAAWWTEWRAARVRQHGRHDPDDMTPPWVDDPNAPYTPSSDPDLRRIGMSFEDETGE